MEKHEWVSKFVERFKSYGYGMEAALETAESSYETNSDMEPEKAADYENWASMQI